MTWLSAGGAVFVLCAVNAAPALAGCCDLVGGIVLGEVRGVSVRVPLIPEATGGGEHVTWVQVSGTPVGFFWLEPELGAKMCPPDESARFLTFPHGLTVKSPTLDSSMLDQVVEMIKSPCRKEDETGASTFRSCDSGWVVINGPCYCRLGSLSRSDLLSGMGASDPPTARAEAYYWVNQLNYALNAYKQFEGVTPTSVEDLKGRGYLPFDPLGGRRFDIRVETTGGGTLRVRVRGLLGAAEEFRYDEAFDPTHLGIKTFISQPKGAGEPKDKDYFRMRMALMAAAWYSMGRGSDPTDITEMERYFGPRVDAFWSGTTLEFKPVGGKRSEGVTQLIFSTHDKKYSSSWLSPLWSYYAGGF